MRKPIDEDEHTPPATPGTQSPEKSSLISYRNGTDSLSADSRSRRSPSPFEPSTTVRSRQNSIAATSTTQGELYDATPSREIRPRFTISSGDAHGLAEGVRELNLNEDDAIDRHSADGERITAGLGELDLNQREGSSSHPDAVRYSMREEQLPAEPYYEHGFQTALKTGTKMAASISNGLDRCPVTQDPDSSLHKLSRDATKLAGYKSPDTRIIGFVGKSGSGKSLRLTLSISKSGPADNIASKAKAV